MQWLRQGLFIELFSVSFNDVTRGLPAMVQWLEDKGCRQFTYDFVGAGWDAMDEEDE